MRPELSEKDQEDLIGKFLKDKDNCYKAATVYRVRQNILQIFTLAGATTIPFILNTPEVPKLIATILSGFVAISAGMANYFKYGERSRNYFNLGMALDTEYDMFLFLRGPYEELSDENALGLLKERSNAILFENLPLSIYPEELARKQK